MIIKVRVINIPWLLHQLFTFSSRLLSLSPKLYLDYLLCTQPFLCYLPSLCINNIVLNVKAMCVNYKNKYKHKKKFYHLEITIVYIILAIYFCTHLTKVAHFYLWVAAYISLSVFTPTTMYSWKLQFMLAGTTQHGTKYWSSNEVLATFPIVPTARVYNHYHLPAGQQAKKHTEAAWRL